VTASVLPPASPVAIPDEILVRPGPALLSGIESGPGLAAHRQQYGVLPEVDLPTMAAMTHRARLRGRGGGGFSFTTKLHATSLGRKRAVVVVNLSESEPGSAKDTALAITRPHLVLDGAAAAAHALGTREIHLALSGKRSQAAEVMARAIAERNDDLTWQPHTGAPRFVAGQSRAVIELLAGRPNQPVTASGPESADGHRGRPTLLSNAETYAQLGLLTLVGAEAYCRLGSSAEPGTTLLTLSVVGAGSGSGSAPEVVEVDYGTPWRQVLPLAAQGRASLVGGYHGAWVSWADLASSTVSIDEMGALGATLGAGAVLTPHLGDCPLLFSTRITRYLADQSARKCGPCFNGLPALAEAVGAIANGSGGAAQVQRLSRLVAGRGACSHPDGTVRMVASMLSTFPEEVAAHAKGECLSTSRSPDSLPRTER
jgi:NADH:ubiquinone oxidoreductase subunit F (NADH-binding)